VIAAQALMVGATLVTANVAVFGRVKGLALPWTGITAKTSPRTTSALTSGRRMTIVVLSLTIVGCSFRASSVVFQKVPPRREHSHSSDSESDGYCRRALRGRRTDHERIHVVS
jgi:hypothetical protein